MVYFLRIYCMPGTVQDTRVYNEHNLVLDLKESVSQQSLLILHCLPQKNIIYSNM